MDGRRRLIAARGWVLAATAFCAFAGGRPVARAATTPLPSAVQGSVTWDYQYGQSGQFGYKDFDFSEHFTWSGTLTNATPGVDAFARYETSGGTFGYDGTQTAVTTPQAGCDLTDSIARTYGGSMTSNDKVELQVYLGADPHAILKAQCGATYHQHDALCTGSPTDFDGDDFRTIAHGDSGSTGVVKILPKGKIDITFDVVTGSATGRPYEYERIKAHFVLAVPCKVDLDAKGVAEGDEESVGALVVRNDGTNDPPRKTIYLRRVNGLAGDLLLTRGSTQLKVFTARTGGSEIAFDGSANRFANSNLPKTLWVEGAEQSETMRDTSLTLASADDPECKDVVKFTVLWMDPPEFRLTAAQSFSPGNEDGPNFTSIQGDDALGYHRIAPGASTAGSGEVWSTESSGVVHPKDFAYPGYTVAVGHVVDVQIWRRAAGSTRYRNAGGGSYFDIDRNGGGPLADNRDDTPDVDGRVYNTHLVGLSDRNARAGSVARYRSNYAAKGVLLKGGHALASCSELRRFWLRFSVLYPAGGGTPTIETSIPGDNDAQEGAAQPLTFDLK